MQREDLEGSYHKNHTVEVEVDGVKQPVAILYLDNLKKSLGSRLSISKKESDKATSYIKAHEARQKEVEKIEATAKANAAKTRKSSKPIAGAAEKK